jgi:hypothetical protein
MFSVVCITANTVQAEPVSETDIEIAAKNWVLQNDGNHFGEKLGKEIAQIVRYQKSEEGEVDYYLITFEPKGWLILPADDEFWPIQSFGGGYMPPDFFEKTIWHEITHFKKAGDSANQYGQYQATQKNITGTSEEDKREIHNNKNKWKNLLNNINEQVTHENGRNVHNINATAVIGGPYLTSEGTIVVPPLLGTEASWGQGHPFNSETTYFKLLDDAEAAAPNNNVPITDFTNVNASFDIKYPVGCAALSTGQLMNYLVRRYGLSSQMYGIGGYSLNRVSISNDFATMNIPGLVSSGISGELGFILKVDTSKTYDWDAMSQFEYTTSPNNSDVNGVTPKISEFLRDIGVLLKNTYNSLGTGTYYNQDVFYDLGFKNAKLIYKFGLTDNQRNNLINTNLDFRHPVLISFIFKQVDGSDVAHACVVDGYAFDKAGFWQQKDHRNPYYHLNTGWSNYDLQSSIFLIDEGCWSYKLTSQLTEQWGSNSYIFRGALFNVFPSFPIVNGTTINSPEIISGRVLSYESSIITNEPDPLPNVSVTVYKNDTFFDEKITDENGVFAFCVPSNAEYKIFISNGYIPKYIKRKVIVGKSQNADYGITGNTNPFANPEVENAIGNRWLNDIRVANWLGTICNDSIMAMAAQKMGVSEDIVSYADPDTTFFTFKEISDTTLNTSGIDIYGVDLLYPGSDPQYDINGSGNYTNAIVNAITFVADGGKVLATGKSSAFPRLLGGSASPTFYPFAGTYQPYGSTPEIPVTILSPEIAERLGGTTSLTLTSALPRSQHSVINSQGLSRVLASSTYVIQELVVPGYGSPYLDYYPVTAPVLIEYDRGTNGGKVIYSSVELSPNYESGGSRQEYVDAILDPVIFSDSDAEDMEEIFDGRDFDDPPTRPRSVRQMNLNMVVYKGGISLKDSATSDDVSLSFTVSNRVAFSTAPQIDSSGEPELILSLYTPTDELYGMYKALPGDRVISVGIPSADNFESGEWKYVVEEVHGFDGNRVVLAAVLDGLYDIYDEEWDGYFGGGGDNDPYDIIVRGASGARALGGVSSLAGNYPSGVIAGTFHFQLGDGRISVPLDGTIKEISFGPFVRPQDVTVSQIDDDLVLAVKGTTDKLTVPGWFRTSGTLNVDFRHDRTQWSATDINRKAEIREPEKIYRVVSVDQRIEGTNERDILTGGNGNTLFMPGGGDDTVSFAQGGNILYYRMGEGHDVITGGSGEDAHRGIRFHNDITSRDISAERSGQDMKINVGGGSITIGGWHDSPENRIDVLEFWNDDIWDARDVEYLADGKAPTKREIFVTLDERFPAANPDNNTFVPEGDIPASSPSGGSGGGCDTGVLSLAGIIFIALGLLRVSKAAKGYKGTSMLLLALASLVTLFCLITPAYAATTLNQQEYVSLTGYTDLTNFSIITGGTGEGNIVFETNSSDNPNTLIWNPGDDFDGVVGDYDQLILAFGERVSPSDITFGETTYGWTINTPDGRGILFITGDNGTGELS